MRIRKILACLAAAALLAGCSSQAGSQDPSVSSGEPGTTTQAPLTEANPYLLSQERQQRFEELFQRASQPLIDMMLAKVRAGEASLTLYGALGILRTNARVIPAASDVPLIEMHASFPDGKTPDYASLDDVTLRLSDDAMRSVIFSTDDPRGKWWTMHFWSERKCATGCDTAKITECSTEPGAQCSYESDTIGMNGELGAAQEILEAKDNQGIQVFERLMDYYVPSWR